MKIAYLSRSAIPSRTANSIHVMKMCQAFAHNGHEVRLLAPSRRVDRLTRETIETFDLEGESEFSYYGVEPVFEIEAIELPRAVGKKLGYAWAAGFTARRWGPNVGYGRDLRACAVAAQLGLPTIYEAHRMADGLAAARRFTNLIRRRAFLQLVVITEQLKNEFAQRFNLDAERIVVAHDAADEVGEASPEPLGESDRLRVGYVGQLYPGKGLEIISRLARRCPWAEFHVVGGEKDDIAHWRRELDGSDNVIFHGFIPHSRTTAYRAAMDVLIAPYGRRVLNCNGNADDGSNLSPLKLFEYMASRKPVVASKLESICEFLHHGETALLYDPEDLDGWVAGISRLRDDSELREGLATRAFAQFLLRHTWRVRAKHVLDGVVL